MVLTFLNISSCMFTYNFFVLFCFVSGSLAELSYLFVFSGQFQVKHEKQSLTD